MKILNLLKRIPSIDKKIKILNPKIEDILLEFFCRNSKLIFFDIGANIGQTIDLINKIFDNATIYAFEPTKTLISDLKKKYINLHSVHIYSIALSDDDKKLNFYHSEFSPTNSCLEPNTTMYKKFNHWLSETLERSIKEEINGIKLDTWYNQNLNNEIIDVVKIDTQGFEYNIIIGGLNTLKKKVKLLIFEIQYFDFYRNSVPFYKIFELLYDNNFYYYCHIISNRRNKYQVLESNVLFINKEFIKPYE